LIIHRPTNSPAKMSGIEVGVAVVGAVAALVGAFRHGHSLYRDWKAAKRIENLEQSLTTGERQLQREYDVYFLRLGTRFASGDAVAVSELQGVIIVLQSHLIQVLQKSIQADRQGTTDLFRWRSNREKGGLTTDTSKLVEISDNARLDSIKALAALSQRLAPIPRSVPETAIATTKRTPIRRINHRPRPATFFCQGAVLLQENRHLHPEEISTPFRDDSNDIKQLCCDYCNGYLWPASSIRIEERSWVGTRFLNKSHTPMGPHRRTYVDLGCIFCDSIEVFRDDKELASHLKSFHTDSDFRKDCDSEAVIELVGK